MGQIRKTNQKRSRLHKDALRLVELGLIEKEDLELFCYVVSGRIGGSPCYGRLVRMELYESIFIPKCDIPFGFPKLMERLQEAKKRLYKQEETVWIGTPGIKVTRLV